jgi:hypothetical protein
LSSIRFSLFLETRRSPSPFDGLQDPDTAIQGAKYFFAAQSFSAHRATRNTPAFAPAALRGRSVLNIEILIPTP